jgi:DNA-binding transcriptional regulator/RsmH inhibitor MraZ
MFFTGTHTPKLDDKGRLFLPAKFRDLLTEDVMIAPGQEHCLQVWSVAGFQSMTSDLARKSQADKTDAAAHPLPVLELRTAGARQARPHHAHPGDAELRRPGP